MPLSKIHRQTRETEVNLELELDGWVGRLPGGLLQRTGQS